MGNSDHGTTYEGKRGRGETPTMALHIQEEEEGEERRGQERE